MLTPKVSMADSFSSNVTIGSRTTFRQENTTNQPYRVVRGIGSKTTFRKRPEEQKGSVA